MCDNYFSYKKCYRSWDKFTFGEFSDLYRSFSNWPRHKDSTASVIIIFYSWTFYTKAFFQFFLQFNLQVLNSQYQQIIGFSGN